MPKVLNRYKDTIPKDAVYIGRPTIWGNPFQMTGPDTRGNVVAEYEKWLMNQPDLVAMVRKQLRGMNLVCFCAPKACHGDILLKIANEGVVDEH